MQSLSAHIELGRAHRLRRLVSDRPRKILSFRKLWPYLLATTCVASALFIRWGFIPLIGQTQVPFMFFVLATVTTAWFGGILAGAVAMIAGELLGDYFFLSPLQTLGPVTALEWLNLVFYFAGSSSLLWVVSVVRRTRQRADRAALLAESRAALLRTGMLELKEAESKILQLESLLEERVRERTAALEAANRDLEAFSYSVCHDLRAPLRSINGFTKAILEDHHAQLDGQAANYLQHVYESSQRMGELIGDLMILSRVSKGELHHETVDLSQIAEGILQNLRTHEAGRTVTSCVQPNLVAWGDQGLLTIVLENLIGNSWKFTTKTAAARVEFLAELHDGEPVYCVRDNGAGFEPDEAKRLFGVFQRLHSPKEFPGTGVGLATVKRILQRHGGDIWAEGKPGQGATFYFTLPPREARPS